MELLKWGPDYEMGLPDLDDEHRHLVKLINQGIATVDLKQEVLLEPVLNELFAYARVHFAHEERLMITAGFPDLHDHVKEHHAFYEKVSDLYSRFLGGDPDVAVVLTTFLRDWLIAHIQGTDRLYVPYLVQQDEV
jgi:hemerythrin